MAVNAAGRRVIHRRGFGHLLITAACVGACSPGRVLPVVFLRPSVQLHHLTLQGVDLSGGTLEAALGVYNPNGIAIEGAHLDAALDVQGTRFGNLVLDEAFRLASRDTNLVTVPLRFQWSGLAAAAHGVLKYGSVDYRLEGTVSVHTPVGQRVEIPFSDTGNVPLLRRSEGR